MSSPGRFACVLVDPVRNRSIALAVPRAPDDGLTLGAVLDCARASTTAPDASLEHRRFADSLFLLTDNGTLADLIPGLRFRIGDRNCSLDHRLDNERGAGPVQIKLDRSQTGYTRNWPAFLARRWSLRADAYTPFVESVVAEACPHDAAAVLRLDTPDRIRRFLAAVAARIHAAPYETYSRYLDPATPFRSCDQTLDRILEGDGGNCAEKAMALDFIAHAYGIPAELVLGGEDASGKFPLRALRAILDERAFDAEPTRDAQRYWQHYALLFHPSARPEDDLFCDVAGSNIPFLVLDARQAAEYLERRMPLPVTITLEPLPLHYHRLPLRQDIPLDLYFAMEHFIDGIDLIHTFDNELGLLHTGDYWLGAFAYRGPRERRRIVAAYEQFAARAGLDPRADLYVAPDLASRGHPLRDRFASAYPAHAGRIMAADPGIRTRVATLRSGAHTEYVLIPLPSTGHQRPTGTGPAS